MHMRLLGLTLLGVCIVGGVIAGFFSRPIEAALTLPAAKSMTPVIPVKNQTTPMTTAPTPLSSPTAVTTPSSMPNGVNILAQDTFQRPNQTFWGTASDGREWDGDTNNISVFSILNNAGQISEGATAPKSTYNGLLGPSITDAEVLSSGSVNRFDQGKVNLGVVLRWTDNNNWYKALIDGTALKILKRVNGITTELGTVPFSAQAGAAYTLRFRAVGAMLFAKAWSTGSAEPQTWMLAVMDTTLPSGFGGVRVLLERGSIVSITSFAEMSVPAMT